MSTLTSVLVRGLFLRCLGVIYVLAFASLAIQIPGLYGSHGILPIAGALDASRGAGVLPPLWSVPTIFWVHASDGLLLGAAWCGVALGVLLALGVAPLPVACMLWVLWLSFVSTGQDFLSFQWDYLLLETGFLAFAFAPPVLWLPRAQTPPSPFTLFLGRWLLFRLMFFSGVVKLASGDHTWRSLTALRWHYETQPIPAWTSWYAHSLPPWVQISSCLVMFAIELAVPFLVFGPRRARLAAFFPLVFLQCAIAVTGNYAYFNLLTLALCLLLLDDDALRSALPRRVRKWLHARAPWTARLSPPPAAAAPDWRRAGNGAFGCFVLAVSLMATAPRTGIALPPPGRSAMRAVRPFAIVSGYGLFANMTLRRDEILIEGSDDGVQWKAYEFRYKPGRLDGAPSFVAPHQPRLDWQMWFAALADCRRSPWFFEFSARLLEGRPEVTTLLETNPFPDAPPLFLRSTLWRYRFTQDGSRDRGPGRSPVQREARDWWSREPLGSFCPVWRLEDGALRDD